jgi:glycerophosphoryl diester phosphodiesterase
MPQTIAHRGYKAAHPENTMGAFIGATKVGAHAIETDIHLTKDGVVVLSHVRIALRLPDNYLQDLCSSFNTGLYAEALLRTSREDYRLRLGLPQDIAHHKATFGTDAAIKGFVGIPCNTWLGGYMAPLRYKGIVPLEAPTCDCADLLQAR